MTAATLLNILPEILSTSQLFALSRKKKKKNKINK